MSLTDLELRDLRAQGRAFIDAVGREDADLINVIYRRVGERFRVDAPHALAVVLAEQLLTAHKRLAASVDQGTQYAEAYLDEKRRVAELRGLLAEAAAAAAARREKRKVAA